MADLHIHNVKRVELKSLHHLEDCASYALTMRVRVYDPISDRHSENDIVLFSDSLDGLVLPDINDVEPS